LSARVPNADRRRDLLSGRTFAEQLSAHIHKLAAFGRLIVANVCYCADCHDAARQIAAQNVSPNVAEPDSGTEYLLFRKDRFTCAKGAERLLAFRLKENSATPRMIASCCDSAVAFDDVRHWVSAYRARFLGDAPPVEMRICTKSRTSDDRLDARIPSYAGYPPWMMLRLFGSMLPMLFASKKSRRTRSEKRITPHNMAMRLVVLSPPAARVA